MIEFFQKLFVSNDFMPHGHCYLWQPSVLWLNVVSDAMIVLAYLAIPLMLIYFVQKRQDAPFHWMFIMFGLFIFGCGMTHLLSIWTVWVPFYRLEGIVKLLTGFVSLATAAMLLPLVPKALELPSIKLTNEKLKKSTFDLARSNKDLEQFAYVASHDLQEPLRMVTGFVQLLEKKYKGQLDQQAHDYIRRSVEGTRRMQSMIDDLLAYSHVDSQGGEMKWTRSTRALEMAMANLHALIQETNAVVTHDDLPIVKADQVQLAQLFQNLVGNAVKFHGDASPKVHVSAKKDEGCWTFSVQDNGIGIDPRFQERIFELFHRLHPKDKYPGTGIGLTVCKRIVERHGGRIWTASNEGKGSTFYFTVPILEMEGPVDDE